MNKMTIKSATLLLLILLLFSLKTSSASAQEKIDGYRDAEFGMTYDQVVKIIEEEGGRIVKEKSLGEEGLSVTVSEGLLGHFQVTEDFGVPAPFVEIEYGFSPLTKKLYMVSLFCRGNYYAVSKEALIKKYGEPIRTSEEFNRGIRTLRNTWVYPDDPTNVTRVALMVILDGITASEEDTIVATRIIYCPPKKLYGEVISGMRKFKN